MGVFLVIVGVLGYAVSGLMLVSATTSIQEILAGVGAVTATLFFVSGVLVSELRVISKKLDPKA